MKKPVYIKCPRCDLNYIDKKQRMCDICKAELNLVSPSILIPDEDDEDERLCPMCHENFITNEESMCYECSKQKDVEVIEDEEDDWEYVAEVVDEPLPVEEIGIDLSDEIEDELEEEEEEEEEVFEPDFEDDFEDDFDTDFEDYDEDEDEDDEDEDF